MFIDIMYHILLVDHATEATFVHADMAHDLWLGVCEITTVDALQVLNTDVRANGPVYLAHYNGWNKK